MFIKAAALTKKNTVKLFKLKLPNLDYGKVLVQIKYSSICHTQIQEISGARGKDNFLPHCLGHEATGIVMDTGKGVIKVKKKDNVCLTWVNSKGISSKGVQYLNNKKKINAGPVNTFSNYAIVSENKVIKLPKKCNFKKDVLMGCAIPTAFNAVFNTLKKSKKNNILIIGSGGLGLACIFACKLAGFKKIYVLDKIKEKLKIAKKFGFKNIILVSEKNSLKKLINLKGLFENAIECSGSIDLMKNSLNALKDFGGKLIIIGNYPHKKLAKLDPWNFIMGKTITGAWQDKFLYEKSFKKFYKYFSKFNSNLFFGKKTYKL